jgi:predicted MFS family arabinose efflux permease
MTPPKTTLRLIGLAAFGSLAAMRICDAMLIALGAEFHVTTGDASKVISAFAVAYGVLQLFYGPLGDRIGKVRVVCFATFACALFSLVTALSPTLDLLILSRAAMGAAAAGIVPMSIAWVGDNVPYEKRQETLARLMGATLSGMMEGQWLGGYAAQHLGWRLAFMVLAAIFLLAAAVLYRNTVAERNEPLPQASSAMTLPAYFRNSLRLIGMPRVRWVLGVTALEGALAYGSLAFIPSRLVEHFGFSPSSAGAVMIFFGVGGLLYSQFARRWLALLGEKGLARLGGLLFALCLMVLAWAHLPWLAAGSCFFAGLGLYMLHNTLQTQATQMAPESRGSAVTLFACSLFLGQSCGIFLIAACLDHGLLAGALSVAGVGLLLLGAWISRHLQARPREMFARSA